MAHNIVFFPRTGVTRVFESYNMAQAYYPSMPVYTRHIELMADFKPHEMDAAFEALIGWADQRGSIKTHDGVLVAVDRNGQLVTPLAYKDLSHSDKARLMFTVMGMVGNLIDKPSVTRPGSKTADGFLINLPAARALRDRILRHEESHPKQVLAMVLFFIEQSYDYYTRDEMRKACNSSEFYRALKTKQDGWRIFRYYRSVLIQAGVLS